jgi:hypothetical protein
MIYGWQFAAGIISLLFIHELGHALAMKALNIPVGPITFLPFLGAVVEMRGHPVSAYDEAKVALAGPVLGTLATLPFVATAVVTGSPFAAALGHWGCMVNLFNLLPVGSLDGGRIAGALSRHLLLGGLLGCGGLIAVYPTNPILYLVFLSGGYSVYTRYFGEGDLVRPRGYWEISNNQRAMIAGMYGGLVVFITAVMGINEKVRKTPEEIRRELGIRGAGWEKDWGEEAWENVPGETGFKFY